MKDDAVLLVEQAQIPDYTLSLEDVQAGFGERCADLGFAMYDGRFTAFVCTRRKEHTRRHATGRAGRIIAVWGEKERQA